MRVRLAFHGLVLTAALLATGCACNRWCCRPSCTPTVAAASPAPCCPPAGAAPVQAFSPGVPVGAGAH